jgi:hypothetical protein
VGDNTFPNYCPMFTGYSEKEIVRICYPNKTTKLDDCPWIWKRFDKANYLTALVEDAPKVSAFNYNWLALTISRHNPISHKYGIITFLQFYSSSIENVQFYYCELVGNCHYKLCHHTVDSTKLPYNKMTLLKP